MSAKLSNSDRLETQHFETAATDHTPTNRLSNSAAFSIGTLFQITTACSLFFACLQFSPLLAIVLTIILTPAIIRTGLIAELYWRKHKDFGLGQRIQYFCSSIGVVLLIATAATSVFAMTSMMFGMLGMLFNALVGSQHLSLEAAVVGTTGGMVLGLAAAIVMAAYVGLKMWIPQELNPETAKHSLLRE